MCLGLLANNSVGVGRLRSKGGSIRSERRDEQLASAFEAIDRIDRHCAQTIQVTETGTVQARRVADQLPGDRQLVHRLAAIEHNGHSVVDISSNPRREAVGGEPPPNLVVHLTVLKKSCQNLVFVGRFRDEIFLYTPIMIAKAERAEVGPSTQRLGESRRMVRIRTRTALSASRDAFGMRSQVASKASFSDQACVHDRITHACVGEQAAQLSDVTSRLPELREGLLNVEGNASSNNRAEKVAAARVGEVLRPKLGQTIALSRVDKQRADKHPFGTHGKIRESHTLPLQYVALTSDNIANYSTSSAILPGSLRHDLGECQLRCYGCRCDIR